MPGCVKTYVSPTRSSNMADNLTPMMRQYHALRRDLPPDTLLLFRLGDFYEMFCDDAREASGILNVALTRRGETPMCGVPYHAAKGYIRRLIAAGKRVAICEQVGEVQAGKLVRRELTRIVSAGTVDESELESGKPNYVAAIFESRGEFGFAYADLSTSEFRVTQLPDAAALLDELARVSPVETLASDAQREMFGSFVDVRFTDGWTFDLDAAGTLLREHFRVQSLDGFGCQDIPSAVCAAGAVLHYLTRQLRRSADHLRRLQPYRHAHYLLLDASTQSHLELVQSRGGKSMTLLGALDRTLTPMGARVLRNWILHPLRDVESISSRQDAIAAFIADPHALADLRDSLQGIKDMERSASRLSQDSGNARDLAALGGSLVRIPNLQAQLPAFAAAAPLLTSLCTSLHALPELTDRLASALNDELPAVIRDGGMIRDGFHADLDILRSASREGKTWIAELQEREIERTGIKSLKVRFNAVFGYFIEITKSNLGAVPEDYTRRQTTAGGERFVTPELKEMEAKILGADDRAKSLEIQIFQELRAEALARLGAIQETAGALGAIDALAGLAEIARTFSYVRPVVDESLVIEIEEGRHPVLDQSVSAERFVPNDTLLDGDGRRVAIITGPNMAGKSTYLRQTALLVLLAQTGSFVPAKRARIGVADRIFTRVGASDDLSRGQSTFMVEMNETANIMNNATKRSLVILDEIGRGTSTFDGLSIAWSVAEFLHDEIGARTLFATHYHELTDLDRTRSGVLNLNVAVREWNDEIIFLRRIVPGRADQSYGIHVARLAGLPEPILVRAREILKNLESHELNAEGKPVFAGTRRRRKIDSDDSTQELDFFRRA